MITFDWLHKLPFWPDQLSDHAASVDSILVAFSFVMVMFTAPVFIACAYFMIRYRRGSPAKRTGGAPGSPWLEAAWSIIPFIVMMVFFVQAARSYVDLHAAVPGSLRIEAIAKQWMWEFQQPDGRRQINTLTVPIDTPIEIRMISQDVIHSLFLPALRIKQDVLPNRYTELRFTANAVGRYRLACAEFCGTAHSDMGGFLVVMGKDEYQAWLAEPSSFTDPVGEGARLFAEAGCRGCHRTDAPVPAPSLAGLYGHDVALTNGTTVVADDDYLRSAILRPDAQIVSGFEATMPGYDGRLNETEVGELIAYIRTLGKDTR